MTRWPRSILALLASIVFVVTTSLATDFVMMDIGFFDPSGKPMADSRYAVATTYRLLFGLGGSWVLLRLAPNKPWTHLWISAGIGLVLSGLGILSYNPTMGPLWYPVALFLTVLPSAWVSGKLFIPKERQSS